MMSAPKLGRLPNERKNFERVPIHHVAAQRRIGLKDKWLGSSSGML